MPDVPVTIVLPSGGTRNAEVPDDVPVKELLPELTTSWNYLLRARMDAPCPIVWTAKRSAAS